MRDSMRCALHYATCLSILPYATISMQSLKTPKKNTERMWTKLGSTLNYRRKSLSIGLVTIFCKFEACCENCLLFGNSLCSSVASKNSLVSTDIAELKELKQNSKKYPIHYLILLSNIFYMTSLQKICNAAESLWWSVLLARRRWGRGCTWNKSRKRTHITLLRPYDVVL